MKIIYIILILFLLTSCKSGPKEFLETDSPLEIFPDYKDVSIPPNIAPLNFLVREDCKSVYVNALYMEKRITVYNKSNQVCFDLKDWKDLVSSAIGNDIEISVCLEKEDGIFYKYKNFKIHVEKDSIDPYLTYRLIEPDYEVFSRLKIEQRCIENFNKKDICNHEITENACMNCHTFAFNDSKTSMFYVRGKNGGAVLNQNGKLRKLNIKTERMYSGSVYGHFSLDGRYFVFSTNVIIPGLHADSKKRMEVFDTKSDVYVADFEANKIISNPRLCDTNYAQTFPCFSADGKKIYYCSAPVLKGGVKEIKNIHYDLISINFENGEIGEQTDTIIKAKNISVCLPSVSPDGKYLIYTEADYGTFPIWHRETELRMLNLQTMEIDSLKNVNSRNSNTYHTFSSNSKWVVFASKRDDGLYGKPYFFHIDEAGNTTKPFVLPQKYPDFYDNCLKSFNIPELSRGAVPFSVKDVESVLKTKSINF
ncbi:MAG: PD40 domain-containing protein [Bacteroidales bacterium]|nr:PD40 domain-containing protein [Bacteroidales bacterium]